MPWWGWLIISLMGAIILGLAYTVIWIMIQVTRWW